MNQMLSVVPDPSSGRELSEQDFQPALAFCEMCILHFTDLALICFERQKEPEQLLWIASPKKRGTFHLEIFAINLANSLLGIRNLVLGGHATQGKVVLRHFVEVSDALLACAAAEDFFDANREAEPDPDLAFRYWQKHLKPSRVREILAKVDAALGAPPELKATMSDLRSGTYGWLSNWCHVHPLGLALSGLGKATDSEGRLLPKFGGLRDESCRITLAKTSTYAWFTLVVMLRLLSDPMHGWYALLKKNDKPRAEFVFRNELLKRYYLSHYSEIHNGGDDLEGVPAAPVT
jgi:hypothetical protein